MQPINGGLRTAPAASNNFHDLCRVLHCWSTKARAITHDPGFPQPIRTIDNGHYLWVADEVDAWLEAQPRISPQDRKRPKRLARGDRPASAADRSAASEPTIEKPTSPPASSGTSTNPACPPSTTTMPNRNPKPPSDPSTCAPSTSAIAGPELASNAPSATPSVSPATPAAPTSRQCPGAASKAPTSACRESDTPCELPDEPRASQH